MSEKDFKEISVTQEIVDGRKRLQIHNPTSYPVIGVGAQGAVFRLSEERCVKVYAEPDNAVWESKALSAARGDSFLPKLYEVGPLYVVMEYIHGPTLETYLQEKGKLDEAMAAQLLQIVKEMRRMKFTRIDTRLGHIIVPSNGKLKVIDHIGAFRSYRRFPAMLLKSLDKVGLLLPFLKHVAAADPKLYDKWRERRKDGVDIEDVPRIPKREKLLLQT